MEIEFRSLSKEKKQQAIDSKRKFATGLKRMIDREQIDLKDNERLLNQYYKEFAEIEQMEKRIKYARYNIS